jgi:hypothetical protein
LYTEPDPPPILVERKRRVEVKPYFYTLNKKISKEKSKKNRKKKMAIQNRGVEEEQSGSRIKHK